MSVVKGNAVIGQSGGPTMVINQSLVGIIQELKKHTNVKKIYGGLNGIEGMLKEHFIDLGRESDATLELVANTPAAALGSCRFKPTREDCVRVFEIFKKFDVRYYFYIGGNDSAETASIVNNIAKEEGYELRVFHVPKTIDNDLLENDHTPGYGSAAKYVIHSFMGNDLDAYALHGIKIDVVMGRNAGWLTAASSLARDENDPDSGPHLIYLPEFPVTIEQITGDILDVYNRLGRCLVAVSEGVIDKVTGKPFGDILTDEVDSHGNKQLSGSGGLGDYFVQELKKTYGKKLRVRSDTLGYAQRSFAGFRSEIDSNEARMVGIRAVEFAVRDDIDGSITIKRIEDGKNYKSEAVRVEIAKVAKFTRAMPLEYINSSGNYVMEEFKNYLRPLVGEIPQIGKLQKDIVRL